MSSGGAGDTIRPRADHDLREPVGAHDEVAVGVGGQQRNVVEIGIGEIDAEEVARLRLDDRPGRHAADFDRSSAVAELAVRTKITVGDQLAGRVLARHLVPSM